MGFPDNWTEVLGPDGKEISRYKDRMKQTGNAVCVPVVDMIMERLVPDILAAENDSVEARK